MTVEVTRTGYAHGESGLVSKPALSGTPARKKKAVHQALKAISAAQRKAVSASDFAGPHNSFPIRNQQDVNSAARLVGHAANPSEVKRRIIAIARRKGLKIPDAWQAEKAANYHARAGQAIAGRLIRGANGKFASSGDAADTKDPYPDAKTDAERVAASREYAGQAAAAAEEKLNAGKPAKGGGKGGKKGGGKGGSPEQRDQVAGELLNDPDLAKALGAFSDDPLKAKLTSEQISQLTKLGLLELDAKGQARLSAKGEIFLGAAKRGDKARAQAALSKAGDKVAAANQKKKPAAQAKPLATSRQTIAKPAATRQPASASRSTNPKPKAEPKPKVPPKPKAPAAKKPTPEEKKLQELENLTKILPTVLDPDLSEALTAGDTPGDLSGIKPEYGDQLVKLGLALKYKDGSYLLSGAGRVMLKYAAKGDAVGTKTALQLAKTRKSGVSNPKTNQKSIHIFKDAQGQWRWILFSSSSFQDRDEETIAQKALEEDVAVTDQTGDCGPLLWWHTKGAVLGQCDFRSMLGRILVESGTFRNETVALAVKSAAHLLGVSIGFIPYPQERFPGQVFTRIRTKERSLLPRGMESNLLTKVRVTNTGVPNPEKELIDMKFTALKALLGNSPEALKTFEAIQQDAGLAQKEALEKGMIFKADATGATMPPPAKKADGAGAVEDEGGMQNADLTSAAGEMGEGEEGGWEDSAGDDLIDQLVQGLHDGLDQKILEVVTAAIQPLADSLKTIVESGGETTKQAVKPVLDVQKEIATLIAGIKTENALLTKQIGDLTTRLNTLEGAAPNAVRTPVAFKGRATESGLQIVPKEKAEELKDMANKDAEGEGFGSDPYALAAARMAGGLRPF